MDVLTALRERRSVRAYMPDPVDESTVRRLIQAAVLAPTAMNAQPWSFAVVQNRRLLQRYSERAKAMLLERAKTDPKIQHYEARLSMGSFNVFYDASTLVVIGANEVGPYTDADCWLAAANLMLAATDGGLGTCVIGFAIPVLNTTEVKRELGFAPAARIVAPIIVGIPAGRPAPVERRDPRIASWST